MQRSVGKVSPRLLTARLRLLEAEGALVRAVHATVPPSTEYTLTPHGRRLQAVIEAMATFGAASTRRDGRAKPIGPKERVGVTTHRLR
ncbi:MAG: winged helix-turn-helix transcriptional regulator [Terriglobales bacterium]